LQACADVENYFLSETDNYVSDEKIISNVSECLAKHGFDEAELAASISSFLNASSHTDPMHVML